MGLLQGYDDILQTPPCPRCGSLNWDYYDNADLEDYDEYEDFDGSFLQLDCQCEDCGEIFICTTVWSLDDHMLKVVGIEENEYDLKTGSQLRKEDRSPPGDFVPRKQNDFWDDTTNDDAATSFWGDSDTKVPETSFW